MQKDHKKAWHDFHIKKPTFQVNNLVFLYDNQFTTFLGKFQMHWLGAYVIKEIIDDGAIQFVKLNGQLFLGKVNGN